MNLLEQLSLPRLDEHLTRVEAALHTAVSSEDPFLSEVAGHLISAGGKRLRPMLVLAATVASGGTVSDEVVQGAVSVELVHLGSLYHDDVIDDAQSRRGVPSVNARWGNLVAIVAGDFLLARASEIAASLGTEVSALLAATIGRLCEGEVAELRQAYNPSRSESSYLGAIAGKTASLMATSCRIGGLTSGASRSVVDALTAFGQAFGVSFQIFDDILDLIGTDEGLGKPAGHDLVEGIYTLPVIRALAMPEVEGELRALLGAHLDAPTRDKARDIIMSTDAVFDSLVEARRHADVASDALNGLADSGGPPDVVRSLANLGHHVLDTIDL
ncbi:MAG TPA: polyprenyl synthetase family protein [Acidimicrobiales bacterium]